MAFFSQQLEYVMHMVFFCCCLFDFVGAFILTHLLWDSLICGLGSVITLGKHSATFVQIFPLFLPLSPFSIKFDSNFMDIRLTLSHSPWMHCSVLFHSVFSFFFSLDNFCRATFRFTDSFLV